MGCGQTEEHCSGTSRLVWFMPKVFKNMGAAPVAHHLCVQWERKPFVLLGRWHCPSLPTVALLWPASSGCVRRSSPQVLFGNTAGDVPHSGQPLGATWLEEALATWPSCPCNPAQHIHAASLTQATGVPSSPGTLHHSGSEASREGFQERVTCGQTLVPLKLGYTSSCPPLATRQGEQQLF